MSFQSVVTSNSNKSANSGEFPLHEAARGYDHVKLHLLVQSSHPWQDNGGRSPLHVLLEKELRGHLNEEKLISCMNILLHIKDKDLNLEYENINGKETALSLAVKNGFEECATLLLKADANCPLEIAIKIAERMPKITLEMFDNAVELEDDSIVFNWEPILQYPSGVPESKSYFKCDQRETEFLYNLLLLDLKEDDRKFFLCHPLVLAFLYFKRHNMKRILEIRYLLTVLLPMQYGIFIYYMYYSDCLEKLVEESIEISSTTPANDGVVKVRCRMHTGPEITVFASIYTALIIVNVIQELIMLFRVDFKYIRSWQCWIERAYLVVMIMSIWPELNYNQGEQNLSFQYPIASMGIFLSFVVVFINIGFVIDAFSMYLEGLFKIVSTFSRITVLFLPLFIGFYMGFRLLFSDIGIYPFILMSVDVGADAYSEVIEDAKDNAELFETFAKAFCVGFILLIVIVFMNFLLALSIKDVEVLNGQKQTASISAKIKSLFYLDLLDFRQKYNLVKVAGKYQLKYDTINQKKEKIMLPKYFRNDWNSKNLPKEVLRGVIQLLKDKQQRGDKSASVSSL